MLFSLGAPKPKEEVGYRVRFTITRVGLELQPTAENPFFVAGYHLVDFIYTEHFAH